MAALNILMRFVHIFSAITLLGGVLAWRFAVIPANAALAAETQGKTGDAVAATWRPLLLSAIVGLLVSGIYNFLRKTGLTPAYHALIGIKILLALHVFAVGYLVCRPGNQKRKRQLTGIAISGFIIVALSAVLRSLISV